MERPNVDETASNQDLHVSPTNPSDFARALRVIIPSRAPVHDSSPFSSHPVTMRPVNYERAAFRPPLVKAHSWPRLTRTEDLAQVLAYHHEEVTRISGNCADMSSALDLLETREDELAHLYKSVVRWQELAQQLEAANVVLWQELDQAQRTGTTLRQIGKEREANLAVLKQEAKNWKLQYEATLYDEHRADNDEDRAHCMVCNKINPMRDASEETAQSAAASLLDPGEWFKATVGCGQGNGNWSSWMCTSCFEGSRPFTRDFPLPTHRPPPAHPRRR